MANWSDNDFESSNANEEVSIMALNVVTDEKGENSSSKQLVEHHTDKWSREDDTEVTVEDIIKNYYMLNEKWLAEIEHNKMMN